MSTSYSLTSVLGTPGAVHDRGGGASLAWHLSDLAGHRAACSRAAQRLVQQPSACLASGQQRILGHGWMTSCMLRPAPCSRQRLAKICALLIRPDGLNM